MGGEIANSSGEGLSFAIKESEELEQVLMEKGSGEIFFFFTLREILVYM